MPLSTAQLCLLRSLKSRGVPVELRDVFLSRCGASLQELWDLRDAGTVEEKEGRLQMTDWGKRIYRRESKGRYF